MWGRLLLSLFWCGCCAFFLGHLRFSAACPAAGYPYRVPHLADSGWLAYSCSGRLWGWRCLGTGVLIHHLVFYLVPVQLAAYPKQVLQPFWLQFAGLLLWWCLVVGLEVSLLRHLVFYHVPCSSSGACSRFPWEFSGHRVSVLLLPW